MIRGKSREAWHASSECVLLETFSQRRIQRLPTLLLPPMLMLPCSLYQPAALAAATPAGVGYDVEADGRHVAKMSAVFRGDLFTCASAKMLFEGFASTFCFPLNLVTEFLGTHVAKYKVQVIVRFTR